MALYFASITVPAGSAAPVNLYSILTAHYAAVPRPSTIPALLPPVSNMVAWLRIGAEAAGSFLLGTSSVAPYYAHVQKLDAPVEFPGGGGRNSIDLKSIFLDFGGTAATVDLAFVII